MSALLFEKDGHVVTLTINRPDARNPLGEDDDGDLFADACARINADRDVRCAILTGAGKAFSAGGNLKSMRERSSVTAFWREITDSRAPGASSHSARKRGCSAV